MYIRKNIFLLIFLSFLIRLLSAYFFHDTKIENEWGILLNNLIQHNTYALYSDGDFLVPSVLMPPLYVFFLYFINILTFDNASFSNIVILIQVVISTASVYFFYKINLKLFSKKISLINSYIFSLFPLNFYAAGQISSITLQVFLMLIFFLSINVLIEKKNIKNYLFFSGIAGLLILIRGEFILIYLFTLVYIFLKNKVKISDLIYVTIITLLIISPYLYRNYYSFNKLVLVKSLGINLWKGNNELSSIQGYENINNPKFKNIKYKIEKLEKNSLYELERDKIFLEEGINNISKQPLNYFYLFLQKVTAFYFIDPKSSYPNYYNPFHIIPVLTISIISFFGLIMVFREKKFEIAYLKNYLFITIVIFSIFFILPRYKLTILPIQIILAGYFFEYIIKKFLPKAKDILD